MNNEFLNSFKRILILTNILGVLYYPTSSYIFLQKIYIFFLTCIFTGIAVTTYLCIYYGTISGPEAILMIIDWIQSICGHILALSYYYTAFHGNRKLNKVFNQIHLIDKQFSKLGVFFDYHKISISVISQSLISCTLITGTAFWQWYSYNSDANWTIFFVLPLVFIPYYMSFFISILFVNLVNELLLRYKKVNIILKEIQVRKRKSDGKMIFEILSIYQHINENVDWMNTTFGLRNLMTFSIKMFIIMFMIFFIKLHFGYSDMFCVYSHSALLSY